MSIEIIKIIRDTEEKAENIKKEAVSQAKQIIADANLQAQQIISEARELSESESSGLLKLAESEGQLLYDGIMDEALKECESVLKNADENMDSAVTIILERIVKTSGDS